MLAGFDRESRTPIDATIDRVLAQRVATVARVLSRFALRSASTGIRAVIHDREVWPSSECDTLWQSYAEANVSRFETSSGAWVLSFSQEEQEHLVALLMLLVVFGWGVVVASTDGQTCIHLDHDGKVNMWGGDHAEALTVAAELARTV